MARTTVFVFSRREVTAARGVRGSCAMIPTWLQWLVVGVLAAIFLVLGVVLLRQHRGVSATEDESPVEMDANLRWLRSQTKDFFIPFNELQFDRLLGKGSQGEVFKARWRGLDVAVKKVDVRTVEEAIVEEFCMEADMLRRLRHPNLTLFLGVCLEHPHLCIATELVKRGSLFDLIHDAHSPLTWRQSLVIAADIARAMVYLHAHQPPLLHRDLKSLNILIDENWRAKVADFGSC